MQQQDHSEKIEVNTEAEDSSAEVLAGKATTTATTSSADEREIASAESTSGAGEQAPEQPQRRRFNWPALIAALAVAAFFALTARFNNLPSPSYVPAAIFSATGCGLLVTAIRKLRKWPGAGLLEAGLSGFGMALLQFAMTFTYPGVFSQFGADPTAGRAFLITWVLVALFAVVLSLAGATIGHLAFAPLRPLPARAQKRTGVEDEDEEDEDEIETTEEEAENVANAAEPEAAGAGQAREKMGEETTEEAESKDEEVEENPDEDEEEALAAATVAQPQRSFFNYVITVVLLGLLPMMAGYVFAAVYDFIMNAIKVSTFSPAFYPTLSVLSGLLPWRLAAPINLNGSNAGFILFTLFWRVPDGILGNPNLFDVQTLESLVFSATGLALLLISMYDSSNHGEQRRPAPWGLFLLLEALLGLLLVLPADLWLLHGLEGILQFQGVLAQLPTIQLLNPTLFILNLVTGTLFTLLVSIIVRRQYQLWTSPRIKHAEKQEEKEENA